MNRNLDLWSFAILATLVAAIGWLWANDPQFIEALRATLRAPFWEN